MKTLSEVLDYTLLTDEDGYYFNGTEEFEKAFQPLIKLYMRIIAGVSMDVCHVYFSPEYVGDNIHIRVSEYTIAIPLLIIRSDEPLKDWANYLLDSRMQTQAHQFRTIELTIVELQKRALELSKNVTEDSVLAFKIKNGQVDPLDLLKENS